MMMSDYYYEQLVLCIEQRNKRITELEALVAALTPKPKIVVERWINIVHYETGIAVYIYENIESAHYAPLYYTQPGRILAEAVPFRWEDCKLEVEG